MGHGMHTLEPTPVWGRDWRWFPCASIVSVYTSPASWVGEPEEVCCVPAIDHALVQRLVHFLIFHLEYKIAKCSVNKFLTVAESEGGS